MFQKEKNYTFLYNLAKLSTPNSLGILGYIMIHSKNVYEALDKLCKYYLLIGNKIKPIFSACDEGYKIVLYFKDEKGFLVDFEQFNILIHLFAILHLINNIIPIDIKAKKITLNQKKLEFISLDNKIDGIDIIFEEFENAIFFDKGIKNIRTTNANEQLLKVFEKEAEETLKLKLSVSELKERVTGMILVSTTELDISLESISKKVGLSPRVLQKRLKEENSSFSKILLELRKKLSIYYLSKDMDLNTISLNLGYVDLSSFFRAFKKWYGKTPSQYKEQNL